MLVRKSLRQALRGHATSLQKREFWPLIAGGVVAVSGAVLAHYLNRAANAVQSENRDHSSGESSAANEYRGMVPQSLGLDIGSSFSRIAFSKGGDVPPLVVENREGIRATASSVLFPQGIKSAVNASSDEAVVGTLARKARFARPHNAFSSVSLLFGGSSPSTFHMMTIDERIKVYSLLAQEMKTVVEAKTEASSFIPTFLSVPNHYDASATSVVLAACRNAGLNCISAVPDAVSTALYVIESGQYAVRNTIDLLLVVDVGGRLIQFSVVAVSGDIGSLPYIIAQRTLFETGGEYFDEAIVSYLAAEFSVKNPGIDLLKDPAAKQRLYDAAESAKIELSTAGSTSISVPFISADQSGPKHLELVLTRAKMESIISKHTARIREPIKELFTTIATCGSSTSSDTTTAAAGSVASVIVTGGGARMPCIKATVLHEVGAKAPVITPSEPEDTNCIGAASVWGLMREQLR